MQSQQEGLFIVVTSFRRQAGFFAGNPLALPTDPTLDNYAAVIQHDFVRYVANSVVVTTGAVAVTLAVSLLAAYTVVRGTGRAVRLAFSAFRLDRCLTCDRLATAVRLR